MKRPLAGSRGSSGDSDKPLARPLPSRKPKSQFIKPPLSLFTTTLWEYPSQHYGEYIQGDKNYTGATPSWVIWQCLQRYTREHDLVIDPMCGSGTTIDVCKDISRRSLGYDLASFTKRPDILRADARKLPVEDAKADFVFIDPPYSTHVDYSDDPRCIGKLDALALPSPSTPSSSTGVPPVSPAFPTAFPSSLIPTNPYYNAMRQVISETHRILKPKRHLALYVSDSFRKNEGFAPIGFNLFAIMSEMFEPVDIVAVVRRNAKLDKGNFRQAADEGNFMMRGFNYLFIMKKQ